jgi:tetratricopeptide (TPR) repeat protein
VIYSLSQPVQIFISHSSKDNYFGFKLVDDLRMALGDESAVWYDAKQGLLGGDSWWDKIEREITARDTFILILSPDAMNSKWVRREYDIALHEGKKIIPVRHREGDVWAYVRTLHIISFVDARYYQRNFQELLAALGLSSGGIPSHWRPKTPETALLQQITPQIEQAFKVQDWSNVVAKADYVIGKAPGASTSPIYHMQGVALFHQQNVQAAAEALHAALALVSNTTQRLAVMQDYAAVFNAQGHWEELLALSDEALQLGPQNRQWWESVRQKALDAQGTDPHQQCGVYRLLRLLMQRMLDRQVLCEFYLAEHMYSKKNLLLQLINLSLQKDDKTQFRAQATAIATLVHPNIAHLIDFGVQKDTPFLVFDVVPRTSLRQLHPSGTSIPNSTIKAYVQQVAPALQYVHNQKHFHGKLMPENMLVKANQEIQLINFHLAIIRQRMPKLSHSIYSPPEEREGMTNVTGSASDQYALAVIVYEWLLGRQPSFSDLSFMDKSTLDVGIFPLPIRESLPHIPLNIEKALMIALDKDPQRRFPSIEDFAHALVNAL